MRLFLPQAVLESWMLEEKADARNGVLAFPGHAAVYPLSPAVHFSRLLSGEDGQGLVSKVKTEAQLAALGGEQLDDAVVFGETAYQVDPGFIALSHPEPASVEQGPSETDLLAAFLLNKL